MQYSKPKAAMFLDNNVKQIMYSNNLKLDFLDFEDFILEQLSVVSFTQKKKKMHTCSQI